MTDTTAAQPAPDSRPWLAWSIGVRVVVRRRLAEGGFSDVLGYVQALDEEGIRIETRRGPVHVPAADIALTKLIPPPPPRRPPRVEFPPV